MDVTQKRVRQIMSDQELTKRQITGLMTMLETKKLNPEETALLGAASEVIANVVLQYNRRMNQEIHEIVEFEIGEPCDVYKPASAVQPEHWQRSTVIGKRNTPTGHEYATSQTGRENWFTVNRLRKVD